MAQELFELELLGGGMERRYRRARPEVEQMPWGTLDVSEYDPALVLAARRSWTRAAYQEHRTGAACATTVRALIEARAPIDLIALAARFPLDEMVHVELCSRMAMELGGATPLVYDPQQMVVKARTDLDPIAACAELVVRFFCVGEALSIPMLHGTWRAATHPLPKAVLGVIVKDEAAHGTFGWTFLDWALPSLEKDDLQVLADAADLTIAWVANTWDDIRNQPKRPANEVHALGWMESEAYIELAEKSLKKKVLEPLRERGIPIKTQAA